MMLASTVDVERRSVFPRRSRSDRSPLARIYPCPLQSSCAQVRSRPRTPSTHVDDQSAVQIRPWASTNIPGSHE
ncbi:uncharacterized protein KMC42_gp88 [Natrialba phage PhiCh1]|nr:uncharacterized protein KMC42_gp88 [Natrialba phage PhiCh1]QBJ01269.1 uncharacterized protein PhiCh1_435 [Natrialba phage PhiCh1]